jgi:hypothetical protein
MRDIIERHNRINGITFAIVEFGLIALFIGTFATWYLLHRKVVMAIITWGITLNCVPVVVYGFRQLAHDRATGNRSGSFWDKKAREQHKRGNPHMLRDTMLLTVGTLLPFVSLAAVLFDVFKPSKP